MTLPLYPCSQAVFVLVVNTVLDSLEEYLLQFTGFKAKYVQAWIDDLRALLVAAETLPDEDARRAASEILRVNLVAQNFVTCKLWQKLKRYISDAFPADIVNIQLAAAGHGKYATAYAGTWADGKAMLTSATTFMTSNLAALTAGGNMPATFPATFNTQADLFKTILADYESSKEAIILATQTKVEAYNEVHRQIMPMMLDGQEIFVDDEAINTQFVFANVLSRISGPGLAGIRGTIVSDAGLQPIPDAVVTLTILISTVSTTYTATTDDEGKYLVNCPSGDYKLLVTADNFVPSAIRDVTVEVGTVSTFNEKLVPVTVEELA